MKRFAFFAICASCSFAMAQPLPPAQTTSRASAGDVRPAASGGDAAMHPPGKRLAFVYSPSQDKQRRAGDHPCVQTRANGILYTEALSESLWDSASRPHSLDDAVLVGRGTAKDIQTSMACPKAP